MMVRWRAFGRDTPWPGWCLQVGSTELGSVQMGSVMDPHRVTAPTYVVWNAFVMTEEDGAVTHESRNFYDAKAARAWVFRHARGAVRAAQADAARRLLATR